MSDEIPTIDTQREARKAENESGLRAKTGAVLRAIEVEDGFGNSQFSIPTNSDLETGVNNTLQRTAEDGKTTLLSTSTQDGVNLQVAKGDYDSHLSFTTMWKTSGDTEGPELQGATLVARENNKIRFSPDGDAQAITLDSPTINTVAHLLGTSEATLKQIGKGYKKLDLNREDFHGLPGSDASWNHIVAQAVDAMGLKNQDGQPLDVKNTMKSFWLGDRSLRYEDRALKEEAVV